MTGTETSGHSKGEHRKAVKQDEETASRSANKREAWPVVPAHHVANQGAPGGTSDDDGDSDNQQDPTRRASTSPGGETA